MAVITDVADAVTAALNAHGFSLHFTAARRYAPIFELQEMKTLRVTVVPRALEISGGTRSESQYDYRIDVAVQQKLDSLDAAELDPLMGLVEEIADCFERLVLETMPEVVCIAVENDPIYAPEHMRESRLFTSVLTLTFRTWR